MSDACVECNRASCNGCNLERALIGIGEGGGVEAVGEQGGGGALPTGAAERKAVPLVRGCLDYFPAALAAIAQEELDVRDDLFPALALRGRVMEDGRRASTAMARWLLEDLEEEMGGVALATRTVTDLFVNYARALAEVARISDAGNRQHNPGEEIHWARGKSTDQADCIARHYVEHGKVDTDGCRHTGKALWRALANLQLELEAEGAPVARGARVPKGGGP